MTSRDFCYWLQGFFEITSMNLSRDGIDLSEEQVDMIKDHLEMVFKHEIDPSMGDVSHQAKLNSLHGDTSYRC